MELVENNRRILIVDDNPSIHDDFRKILGARSKDIGALEDAEAGLFGTTRSPVVGTLPKFEMTFAHQGEEALQAVRDAAKAGKPFAMAFMDVRMPPGWDGVETTAKIWEVDPQLQIVFCTAFSDYSLDQMIVKLGHSDKFAILKKPFDAVEVLQMANAFTEKWRLHFQERRQVNQIEQTVRMRTEELLRSEERFRLMVEQVVGYAIFMLDPEGRVMTWNTGAERSTGYKETEITGKHFSIFSTPEDLAAGRPDLLLQQARNNGHVVDEGWRVCKDGSRNWVKVVLTALRDARGQLRGFSRVVQDLTERKRAEEQLILQTSALEAADNGIVITDRAGKILWVNTAFSRLTGYAIAEVVGKSPALLKSGVHDRLFYEAMWTTILSGRVWSGEIINRRKDGSQYCEEMRITPVLNPKGEIQHFVAIKHDISQRKQFEQALAYERDLLRTLMENSPDYIYFKDLDSRFLRCSKTLAARFGFGRVEDMMGKCDADFFDDEYAHPALEEEREVIRTGTPLIGKVVKECLKGSSQTTWALTNKMPLRNKTGKIIGTFGISKDITALKEAEQGRQLMELQLRQAQKLEAIGQLAAGIAHEINTPTQYVGDNTRFLKDSFGSIARVLQSHEELLTAVKGNAVTPELVARVEEVLSATDLKYLFEQIPAAIRETLEGVERVTKIVRAMKEFSHPGSKEKAPADLNKAIETTVSVARNEWRYVAEMTLDLDPSLPSVPCFIGELNQVMLNLIVNASHAIGDVVKLNPGSKGMITVRTRRDGDFIEIRVGDTGTGIPESVRPKIFEPFFTTKDVGKGTGQGLSIVYGSVVKKHGGAVSFETEMGKGTTFILRLPIVPPPETEPKTAGATPASDKEKNSESSGTSYESQSRMGLNTMANNQT